MLPNKCTIFQAQTQAEYGLFKDVHGGQGRFVLTRRVGRAEALPDSVGAPLGLDAPPSRRQASPASLPRREVGF